MLLQFRSPICIDKHNDSECKLRTYTTSDIFKYHDVVQKHVRVYFNILVLRMAAKHLCNALLKSSQSLSVASKGLFT